MNIVSTALLAGALASLPATSSVDIHDLVPGNPIEKVEISAAGISLEYYSNGLRANLVETTDFVINLTLKSGPPIRVHL